MAVFILKPSWIIHCSQAEIIELEAGTEFMDFGIRAQMISDVICPFKFKLNNQNYVIISYKSMLH